MFGSCHSEMAIRKWLASAVAGVTVIATGVWAMTSPTLSVAVDPAQAEGRIGDPARGALVFAAGDCASCHASPGQSDRLRLGGGMALASPYGIFRVPNISSDRADGIGAWAVERPRQRALERVSPNGSQYLGQIRRIWKGGEIVRRRPPGDRGQRSQIGHQISDVSGHACACN
jgi:hypothetical protein